MSVQIIKESIHKLIDKIEDEKLLQAYLKIIESSFERDHRTSIDSYNREIAEGDSEIDRGEYLNHKDAVKKISAWKKGASK